MSIATGHCLLPVPHLHMLRFPIFSCYISPIASYPSLYKHNASLVRYNQTRFADSKYCGFVKTVFANMEKVIRICKDSFSPLVPPAASASTSSSSSTAPRRTPPSSSRCSSTAKKPASPWRRATGRITAGRPSRPGTGGKRLSLCEITWERCTFLCTSHFLCG